MKPSWLDKRYKRDDLPNDVESLKDIIERLVSIVQQLQQQNILLQQEAMDLRHQNEELRQQNLQLQQENFQLKQEIEELRSEIKLLKQEKFGKKSEKTGTHSYSKFLAERLKSSSKKHPGRQALPEHLERVRVEYDLSEEEKICPLCQGAMEKIQEISTEQLDLIPASLQVKQHVRFQYACRKCYGSIKRAEFPPQPIDKGLPTSRLLAQVIMSKFADHMPFYRQESWFLRQKCPISRSTMWGWEEKAAFELLPLVNCLKEEIQERDHVFGDDTPMPTLDPGRGKTRTGRFWTYGSPKAKDKAEIVAYEYTLDRKGIHPQRFLKRNKGYLQCDAYAGFNKLFKNEHPHLEKEGDLKPAGCWGHARRKFVDALKIDPTSIAQEAFEMIQGLYRIEHVAREENYEENQRKNLREEHSKPILKRAP